MELYKSGRATEYRPFGGGRGKSPPGSQGEYRILNKEKKVMYIGITNNLNRRMKEHIHTGKLNDSNCIFAYKQADGRASQDRLRDHERSKIIKHDPELNLRAGGGGRRCNPRNKKSLSKA